MKISSRIRWAALLCTTFVLTGEPTHEAHVAYTHALPKLDGGHLQVSVVEATYGPGGSSMPHSHPCPVIGYVLEGAVRMQVKGDEEKSTMQGRAFIKRQTEFIRYRQTRAGRNRRGSWRILFAIVTLL